MPESQSRVHAVGEFFELEPGQDLLDSPRYNDDIAPTRTYPLQQLADICANELNDMEQARYYQNRANKINKFF